MALGTNHKDATALDVMIPEIWSEGLNDYFRQRLTMANFFTDLSDDLAGGGDTVHIPNLSAMSANTKASEAEVTLNAATETDVDLTVNTWKEVSFLIEDREAAQVKQSYNLQQRYIMGAAYEVAEELEDAIAALFAGFSTTAGTDGTALTDAAIRAAISELEEANVPGIYDGDVAFFMHPSVFWKEVQNLDKFSLAQNTPSADPVLKRPQAYLYGIPVIVSSNVPTTGTDSYANALVHKDAIVHARLSLPETGNARVGSEGVRIQTNYVPEYLGYLSTADLVYGAVENRDNAGVLIYSDRS